jgi:hypothetical protein
MRERLYWIALGGICFWLPSVVSVVLDRHLHPVLRTFVILPLAEFAFLCAASWIASRREPKWGWILAGIYVLGSILNLGSVVFHVPFQVSLNVSGEITWRMILLCLLPHVYLWMAVLIVTPALVAMRLRPKRVID